MQSSLGGARPHVMPSYTITKLARVTGTKNYTKGKIEVTFLDHGKASPVWIIGDLDREPAEGDMVLIGFIDGRKDSPYLAGFVANQSKTSNMVRVNKDRILLTASSIQFAGGTSGSVADIYSKLSNLASRVTSLENRMTNAEGRISSLESRMTNVENSIQSVQSSIESLDSSLQNMQTTIQNLQSEINNLRARVEALENQL